MYDQINQMLPILFDQFWIIIDLLNNLIMISPFILIVLSFDSINYLKVLIIFLILFLFILIFLMNSFHFNLDIFCCI